MNRNRTMGAALAGCTIDTIAMVRSALRFLEPSLALGARKRFGRIVARSQITERLRGRPHELPDPTTTRTSTRQLPKQDSDDQKDPRYNKAEFRWSDHPLIVASHSRWIQNEKPFASTAKFANPVLAKSPRHALPSRLARMAVGSRDAVGKILESQPVT
jgi:hypothetical protein